MYTVIVFLTQGLFQNKKCQIVYSCYHLYFQIECTTGCHSSGHLRIHSIDSIMNFYCYFIFCFLIWHANTQKPGNATPNKILKLPMEECQAGENCQKSMF